MRKAGIPLLLASSLLVCMVCASSQTATFRIAGRVVHTNGNPVRGAQVAVSLSQRPQDQVSTVTGDSGDFVIAGLAPGKYPLQVSYHGWSQFYKQFDDYNTGIAVGPGLDSEHIEFPLDTPASIIGTVSDDVGDPVRSAMVYLFRQSIRQGAPQIGVAMNGNTGSDGSFHFAHLAAGTYYLAVSGRPWYAQNAPAMHYVGTEQVADAAPPPELDVAYPVTYYANSTNADSATPIKLDQGARMQIQFTLQPVAALHIAFEGVETNPGRHTWANLQAMGPGGALIPAPIGATETGVNGIAPGRYVISAYTSAPNNTNISLGTETVSLQGDSTVNLNAGVRTIVKGRVVCNSGIPQSMAVLLEAAVNSNQAAGFVARDGSFSIDNVAAGRYNLRLSNTPDMYLSSVDVKGALYSKGVLEIREGAQVELTIKAASGLTKLDGVAVRDEKPFAGAMVLLVPQDYSHGNYIPRDQSDSDGTFTLNLAPPGRYTLLAIDDGRDLEYANPAQIAAYLPGGRAVELPLPPNSSVQVQVQARK